jgi:hypothetical protein
MYEPCVAALSERLLMLLTPWFPEVHALDGWQESAWEQSAVLPQLQREGDREAPAVMALGPVRT